MIRSTPDDILLLIFGAVVDSWATPEAEWPDVAYSSDLAAAPFHLAAVCRQWRTLTVANSTFWTYFGFPRFFPSFPRHHGRLSLLLERSRDAPVDVVLFSSIASYSNDAVNNQVASDVIHVFKALNDIAPRWRSISLHLPELWMRHFQPALRGVCPVLESLALISRYPDISLPRAPRLERLCFAARGDVAMLEPELAYGDLLHYPNLKWLLIDSPRGRRTTALYKQNSTHLNNLCILEEGEHPLQPLQCPNLSSLALDDLEYLNHIAAPNLRQLTVPGGFAVTSPLECDWSNVTTLNLHGDFEEPFLVHLRVFQRINTLVLELPPGLMAVHTRWGTAYNATGRFFKELRETRPYIWPSLERLRFARPLRAKYPVIELDEQGLIDFVVDRNSGAGTVQDQSGRPAKIIEVILENPAVSPSTREKLAELIGTS